VSIIFIFFYFSSFFNRYMSLFLHWVSGDSQIVVGVLCFLKTISMDRISETEMGLVCWNV